MWANKLIISIILVKNAIDKNLSIKKAPLFKAGL